VNEITLSHVLDRARRCSTQSQFQRNYYPLYLWAKERDLLGEVEKVLPLVPAEERGRLAAAAKAYSDEELIADAKKYPTRRAWKQAGMAERAVGAYSHYGAALHRNREFMQKCCAHMPDERGTTVTYRYSDEELLVSARQFQTRGAWKTGDFNCYQSARRRPIWDECVAHMRPAANPFAKDYIVYAYEFADGYCYVGLTFVPENRKIMHLQRGPVFDHMLACSDFEYKVLESGLSFTEVGPAEDRWQASYAEKGWKPLHTAKAGSLGGGIHGSKWTEDAVKAEARKYKTKQEWIDRSQFTYRLAKKMGWYDEASAHMPKRVLGVGAGVAKSPEAREKMRQAKLGREQSPEHRAARAEAVKKWWAERRKLKESAARAVRHLIS
jgi:hypothetical protein